MAEIKDKVVTVESLSALHEYNEGTYVPKVDPSVRGNLEVNGTLSMCREKTSKIGAFSATFGYGNSATGSNSYAEGVSTIATGNCQHVQGRYNLVLESGKDEYDVSIAHVVGNGTSETNRSNAHTLDWDGNAWYAGDVYVGGSSKEEGTKLVKSTNVISIEYGDELPAAGNTGRIFFKKLSG